MLKDIKGQSFAEALFVSIIITVFMFAAVQVCIIVVDDITANEAAFAAVRSVAVAKRTDIQNTAKDSVAKILAPFMLNAKDILYFKTTHWDEQILGGDVEDHGKHNVYKHNVKILYKSAVIFLGLFGTNMLREQSARARMIKSPDEEYYNKAYPDAKEFPKIK